MTDHPSDTHSSELAEPVAAASPAAAGSASLQAPGPSSAPTPGRDLLRSLACAVLVGACVASPSLVLFVAPFIPVVVALRLVCRAAPVDDVSSAADRRRARRTPPRNFLVSASAASIVAAVLASRSDAIAISGLAFAIAAVPVLGIVHARATRPDPVVAGEQPDWPEPRFATGFNLTVVAWTLATVAILAVVLVTVGAHDLRAGATDLVDQAYQPYQDACARGGVLASNDALCDELLGQRRDVLEFVRTDAAQLLGAIAALFAIGAAGTAHLVVLARARRLDARTRPRTTLAQLEVHWSWAYVLALGLLGYLVADRLDSGDLALAAASFAVSLGALALITSGFGLLAWSIARSPRPGVLRAFVVLTLLVASPIVGAALFGLGVVDQALHPRRRQPAPASPG